MTSWSPPPTTAVQDAQIIIPASERLGNVVIEADNQGFGDRLLIEDLDFKLPPGGIVGVIGPNGAGKSTLFKMITGAESRMAAKSASAIRSAWLCRPEPRPSRREQNRLGGNLGRQRHHQARQA
jgi:ATPase subunit of ABC transporter with duplicated ATPase domains